MQQPSHKVHLSARTPLCSGFAGMYKHIFLCTHLSALTLLLQLLQGSAESLAGSEGDSCSALDPGLTCVVAALIRVRLGLRCPSFCGSLGEMAETLWEWRFNKSLGTNKKVPEPCPSTRRHSVYGCYPNGYSIYGCCPKDRLWEISFCSGLILLSNLKLSVYPFKRKFVLCKHLGKCKDFQPCVLPGFTLFQSLLWFTNRETNLISDLCFQHNS